MSRFNFLIGLILGAIGGWLGDTYFGRTKLENQISALRAERVVIQGQAKDAERVMAAQSAEIADLKAALSATVDNPVQVESTTIAANAVEYVSEPDDLRAIEGIGPKAFGVLVEAGVSTFAQMAAMDGQALMDILKTAKLRGKFFTDSWPEQAAIAATGDLDALTKLQKELVGGRRVS